LFLRDSIKIAQTPFSLWEKGWGRGGVANGRDTQALSPTLSQREREFKKHD